MGLFIHTYLNSQNIEAERWEAVYEESLLLLRKFPLPLMRVKTEEIGEQKRFVYTSQILCDAGTPDERWEIIGDLNSRQRAEQFELYRHKETQFRPGFRRLSLEKTEEETEPVDVFWAEGEALAYVDGNGVDLFGNKTQGYPYHLAVLAVAMLIESRFPEQCYVFGDIDRFQAETMQRWCNSLLERPVAMPIVLDGERLFRRMTTVFDDPRHALQRFQTLFRGTGEEQLELLLREADRQVLEDDLVEDLAHYSSLSQLGAERIISRLLCVTKDLRYAIDLVLKAQTAKEEASDDFSLPALLKMLCGNFITFDVEAREPLNVFLQSQERLKTIEDSFTQIFLMMSGAPSAVDFYCDASELLETFCSYQPEQRADFQAAITDGEAQCRKALEQTQELIREIEKKMAAAEEKKQAETAAKADEKADAVIQFDGRELSDEEAYIMQQAALQTKSFPFAEVMATEIHPKLRSFLDQQAEKLETIERDELLQQFYWASHENGFALKESAWKRIDDEDNLTTLKYLLMLALIKQQEMTFWNWRIHCLEHPQVWPYLSGEKRQEAPQKLPTDTPAEQDASD